MTDFLSKLMGFPALRIFALLLIFEFSIETFARFVPEDDGRKPFSLEDILFEKNKILKPEWISENEISYEDPISGNIMGYDMIKERIIVESSVLNQYKSDWYSFSYDLQYLLIGYSANKNFDGSVHRKYVVYSLRNKKYVDLDQNSYLQHAEWVTNRNEIIFIKGNNIYHARIENGMEIYPITTTGVTGKIYNGINDWVYEEEIIGAATSIYVSPDGEKMAFLSIDDREVENFSFMTYGEPGSMYYQYTQAVNIAYPKPGTSIPKYEVWHYTFADRSLKSVAKFQLGKEIVYSISWVTNNSISIVFSNRVQNESETYLCHLEEGSCELIFFDRNTHGWANFEGALISKDEDRFLVRIRQMVNKREYYHLYRVDIDRRKRAVLTNGPFMVKKITDWDQKAQIVYYSSYDPEETSSKHIYSVPESLSEKPFCITCQMKTSEGTPCKSGNLKFSKNFKYFIGYCTGPTPTVVSLFAWNGPRNMTLIKTLDDSTSMRKFLGERLQPGIMDLKVKVTDTVETDVRLYLPPGIDLSGKEKYPMIIYTYSGPDTAQITNDFKLDLPYYFATNKSIIYGLIDGRGTGKKDTTIMYAIYKALGTFEVQDQITSTRYIRDALPFIDKDRIGIWGWSYGGYCTAKVLENDINGVFKCGVSVAPVTDWMYYNSFYTERFMDLPANNREGYHEGSLLYNFTNLRNKQFLLIHGTADDNVHFQQTMHFTKVLEREKILFDMEVYPDEDHNIGRPRLHLYYKMVQFWDRCFNLSSE